MPSFVLSKHTCSTCDALICADSAIYIFAYFVNNFAIRTDNAYSEWSNGLFLMLF